MPDLIGIIFGDDEQPGIIGGITQGLHDAVVNVSDAIYEVSKDLIQGSIDLVTNLWNDFWSAIFGIPKAILNALKFMFQDPDFWMMIILFFGLVTMGTGLAAAIDAPMGFKTEAFYEASGAVYKGMKLEFITKMHRLVHLVSPQYRENFTAVLGSLPEQMTEAGIDIGFATALISSVHGLAQSTGALMGKDWGIMSEEWNEKIMKFGAVTSETLQKWGKNPELMIDWIDETLSKAYYTEASERMNMITDSLNSLLNKTDKFVSEISKVRIGLGKVAKDIDGLTGSNYKELLDTELIGFDEIITVQWDILRSQIISVSDIFSTEIPALERQAFNNVRISKDLADAGRNTLEKERYLIKTYIQREILK